MEKVEQDYVILPGGVHLWGPDSAYLGAIPEEVIARESVGQTLKALDTPGWMLLVSKNVVIRGDVPAEVLHTAATMGEELNKMLFREIGRIWDTPRYSVRIFKERGDFCEFASICGASTALSLYDPRHQEIALHFGPGTDLEEFERTYAHEFTHAFMDKIYRVTEPLWFAEGMAEYFRNLGWTDGGYRPTRKNSIAVIHLAEGILPLKDLLNVDRTDVYGVNFPAIYANAWAFTKFLIRKHPLVVETLLNRVKMNLSYLEPQYKAYVTRMLRG